MFSNLILNPSSSFCVLFRIFWHSFSYNFYSNFSNILKQIKILLNSYKNPEKMSSSSCINFYLKRYKFSNFLYYWKLWYNSNKKFSIFFIDDFSLYLTALNISYSTFMFCKFNRSQNIPKLVLTSIIIFIKFNKLQKF